MISSLSPPAINCLVDVILDHVISPRVLLVFIFLLSFLLLRYIDVDVLLVRIS